MEIVLVEDSEADAEMIMRALSKSDRVASIGRITHIRDGLEALAYLAGDDVTPVLALAPQRLVLLDLKLPGLDGIQIVKRLKERGTTKVLPIVVLTSSEEERDKVASYDLGVSMYLRKPVDVGSLSDMVTYAESYWTAMKGEPT